MNFSSTGGKKKGSKPGTWPEPRELPPSQVWDEDRLRVRSWGGGGMPKKQSNDGGKTAEILLLTRPVIVFLSEYNRFTSLDQTHINTCLTDCNVNNVRSLENKLDSFQLSRSTLHETRDCCVFVFTETWLNDNIPDSAVQMHGLTCYRADRDTALSGKTRGGGLCVYINKGWCNNAVVVTKHCSSLVEFMFVKCRPFYLPREFTAIVIVAVYIPPCANSKDVLRELYSAISEQQTNNPDAFYIIAGDFNHANLKSVLPKFYQYVNFATRGNNTLDLVYTTHTDHFSNLPNRFKKRSQYGQMMVNTSMASTLQDCFQCTDWNMFREAATYNNHTDLHEYTETVTAYIKKYIDDVTVTKTITTRANQKPWMTAEVRGLLKTRDDAFRSGDKAALKTARANLSRGIKQAKRLYAQKINNHFTDSKDTRSLWQAIQTITDYKPLPQACDDDTALPDALNKFYARFEMQNDTPAQKLPTPPNNQALCLSPADVRKTLSRVNPRKAAGPDNIPGRVLRDCAAQLTDVLTDIFNTSLSQAVVPTCLKSTSIIPVPKKSPVSCLNDYRPIALTPIMMKCFERLVMRNIKTSLPNTLDPLQFAYRPNRSTDDAISSTLHLALTHLENKDSYVRMLFIDFSSAFNTIIPQQLINKLILLGLNTSLCNWILDFLTGRPQSVRVGHNISSTTTLSTGAPQGCVLSPLLFTLLTHDCTAKFSSNHIIKFADDTTVVGLISNNDETHYREEVAQLVEWCGANNLSLNVTQLWRESAAPKFLGVHITEDLTWTTNTMSLSKKAQQRLHFLRRLKRASLPPPILTTFYRGTIESVLTSCITVWYGNCSAADRKTLQRTVNTAAKIIGAPLPSLLDIFLARCSGKATSIVKDPTHPSHHLFQLLPSGRRYRSIRARSARLLNSFFPQAVSGLDKPPVVVHSFISICTRHFPINTTCTQKTLCTSECATYRPSQAQGCPQSTVALQCIVELMDGPSISTGVKTFRMYALSVRSLVGIRRQLDVKIPILLNIADWDIKSKFKKIPQGMLAVRAEYTQPNHSKWQRESPNIKVGTTVMIVDPYFPRALWLIGQVPQVFPGVDNRIRTVKVKVKDKWQRLYSYLRYQTEILTLAF
ncbi:hypothetical protein H4Q32_029977 [Labeo rohita]|uniref:Reverse transcriptase domain-containing protein n=1 Tax=Labeo rohita TaxID=84645 RepID=A0ABQ8L2F5_LABRO|nr:hypothetical protein H4Q32_029977 [Labeo rohita]